jgi:hypothetical protein
LWKGIIDKNSPLVKGFFEKVLKILKISKNGVFYTFLDILSCLE